MPDPENEYLRNTHSALTKKVGGFNKTYEEFSSSMADESYAKNVHNALTKKVGGFTKTYDEFYGSTGLKKKVPTAGSVESQDLSQGVPGGTLTEELAGSTSGLEPSTSESQGNGIDLGKIQQAQAQGVQGVISPSTQQPIVPVSELGETLPPVAEGTPPVIEGTPPVIQSGMGASVGRGAPVGMGNVSQLPAEELKDINKFVENLPEAGAPSNFEADIISTLDAEDKALAESSTRTPGSKSTDKGEVGLNSYITTHAPQKFGGYDIKFTNGDGLKGKIYEDRVTQERENDRYVKSLNTLLTNDEKSLISSSSLRFQDRFFGNIDDIDKFNSEAPKLMKEIEASLPDGMTSKEKERVVHGIATRTQARYEKRKGELEKDAKMRDLAEKSDYYRIKADPNAGRAFKGETYSGDKLYPNISSKDLNELIAWDEDKETKREGYIYEKKKINYAGQERFTKAIDNAANEMYTDSELQEKTLNKRLNDLYDSKGSKQDIENAERVLRNFRNSKGIGSDKYYDPATNKRIGIEDASPAIVEWNKKIDASALELSQDNTEEDLNLMKQRAYSEMKSLEDQRVSIINKSSIERYEERHQAAKARFLSVSKSLDLNKSITSVERNAWERIWEGVVEGAGIDYASEEDDVLALHETSNYFGVQTTKEEGERAEQRFVDKLASAGGTTISAAIKIMGATALTRGTGAPAAFSSMTARLATTFAKGEKSAKLLNGISRVVSNAAITEANYQLTGESGGAGEALGGELGTQLSSNLAFLGNSKGGRILRTLFSTTGRATGETLEEASGKAWTELMKDQTWSEALDGFIGDEPGEELAITFIMGGIFASTKLGTDWKNSKIVKDYATSIRRSDSKGPAMTEAKAFVEELYGDLEEKTIQSLEKDLEGEFVSKDAKKEIQGEIDKLKEKVSERKKVEFKGEDLLEDKGSEDGEGGGNIVNIKEVEGELSNYTVDGKVRSDNQVIENLSDPEFVEKVKSGETNLDIQNPSPEVKTALEESGLLETKQDVKEEITPETKVDETPVEGEQQATESVEKEFIEKEEGERSLKGDKVSTGKPIRVEYNKNLEKAPDMGSQFGQDIEASGDYITQSEGFTPEGFETGSVEIKNPLVVEINEDAETTYKEDLSAKYDGKTGEELSEAIKADGYDAIVSKYADDGSTGEIVLLDNQRTKTKQDAKIKETKGEETKVEETKVLEEPVADVPKTGTTNLTQAISDSKVGEAGILTNDQKVFDAIKEVSKEVSEETGLVGQKLINEVAKRVNEVSEGRIETEDVVDLGNEILPKKVKETKVKAEAKPEPTKQAPKTKKEALETIKPKPRTKKEALEAIKPKKKGSVKAKDIGGGQKTSTFKNGKRVAGDVISDTEFEQKQGDLGGYTKRGKDFDSGGVFGVSPESQFKLNQGGDFGRVHVLLNEKDALEFTKKGSKVNEEVKKLAREERSDESEVVLDLRNRDVAKTKGPKVFKKQNAGEVDKLTKEAKTSRQKTALGTVKNIIKALGSINPDLEVLVHETEDSYLEAMGKEAKGTSGALATDGKIHLNLSRIKDNTALHEAAHVVIAAHMKANPKAVTEFKKQLEGILPKSDLDSLNDFANEYEADGQQEVDEEFVVEALSRIANGEISLNKTILEKIKELLRTLAKKLGMVSDKIKLTGKEDVKAFAEKLTEAFDKGKELEVDKIVSAKNEIKIDTKSIVKKQKIGGFNVDYFEDTKDFDDLVKKGLVVNNYDLNELPTNTEVAVTMPDNMFVATLSADGEVMFKGEGGVFYVPNTGNVWASGGETTANGLAKLINSSLENSQDGVGRLMLVRGSQDKMISSTGGVKAAMSIVEKMVNKKLISRSDFRKALTVAGKKYGIDFSGSDSSSKIREDIQNKFMNVKNSSFARRGDFFSDMVTEIGKLDSAKENIKGIREFLGTGKRITFSKQGVREQIGTILTERLLLGLPSGHAYAIIEVTSPVEVIEQPGHESYPFVLKTTDSSSPVLKLLSNRENVNEVLLTKEGTTSEEEGKSFRGKLGLAQRGIGTAKIKGKDTAPSQTVSTVTNPAEHKIEGGKVKFQKTPKEKKLFREPNQDIINVSEEYKKSKGINKPAAKKIFELDVENSKSIADAYEAMENNPSDPKVKKAYTALANEVTEQFNALIEAGYKVELYKGKGEPYANSSEMLQDLRDNKRLKSLSTESDFGKEGIGVKIKADNPMLADSGLKDVNGKSLLVNDLFRFVHDVFGHGEQGTSFGAIGEENAWNVHSKLFSDDARRALTTETRGQNSWVNFGPQMRNADGSVMQKGDPGYLSPMERPFADQKNGLLPDSMVFEEKPKFQKSTSEDIEATKDYISQLNETPFLSGITSEEILKKMTDAGYDVDLETVNKLRNEALEVKSKAEPIKTKKTPKTVMGRFIQSGLTEEEANRLARMAEKKQVSNEQRLAIIDKIEAEVGLDKAYELTSNPEANSIFSQETIDYFATAKADSLKKKAAKTESIKERNKLINQAAEIQTKLATEAERAGQITQFKNATYDRFPDMRISDTVVDTINKKTAEELSAPSSIQGMTVGEEIEGIRTAIEEEIKKEVEKEIEGLKEQVRKLKEEKAGESQKKKGRKQISDALAEIKKLASKKTPSGPASAGIPGLSPDMVNAIAKLVAGYVNVGIGSTKAIVDKVMKDLKSAGIKVNKSDIEKIADANPELSKIAEIKAKEEEAKAKAKEQESKLQETIEDFYINGNSGKTSLAEHMADKLGMTTKQAQGILDETGLESKIQKKVKETANKELDKNLKKSDDLTLEEKADSLKKKAAKTESIKERNKLINQAAEIQTKLAERKKQQAENNKIVNKVSKTIRLGGLAGRDFTNDFADKYGFATVTAEQMALLEQLVLDADRFEESGQRELHQKTQRRINTEIRKMKPKDAAFYGKLAMELAYLNALSGLNTQGNANIGALSTSSIHLMGKSLEQLARGKIGAVSYGFRAMRKSLKAASKAATEARRFNYSKFQSHNSYMEGATNQKMGVIESEVLKGFGHYLSKVKSSESAKENTKNIFKAIGSTLLQYSRMNFLLNASDAFLTTQFSEFNNAIEVYNKETKEAGISGGIKKIINRKDLIKTLDEAMGYDQNSRFEKEVDQEIEAEKLKIDEEVDKLFLSPAKARAEKKRRRELTISKGYKARRVQELMIQERDQEIYAEAVKTARDWIMLSDPDGVLGALNESLKRSIDLDARKDPTVLRTIGSVFTGLTIMFSRMTAKTANAVMTSIPVIGLIPATIGWSKNKEGKWTKMPGLKPKADMLLFKRRVVANMLMTAVGGVIFSEMFEWDDDDEEWKLDPNRLVDFTFGTKGDEQAIKGATWGVGFSFRNSPDEEFGPYRTLKYAPQTLPITAAIGYFADQSKGLGTKSQLETFDKAKKSYTGIISGTSLSVSFTQMLEGSFNSIGRSVKKITQSKADNAGEKVAEAAFDLTTSPLKTITQPNFYRDLINEAGGRGDVKKAYPDSYFGRLKYDYYGLDAEAENKTDIFGYEYKTQGKLSQWVNGAMNDNYDKPEWKILLKYPQVSIPIFKANEDMSLGGATFRLENEEMVEEYGDFQKLALRGLLSDTETLKGLNEIPELIKESLGEMSPETLSEIKNLDKLPPETLQKVLDKLYPVSVVIAKASMLDKYSDEIGTKIKIIK